MRGFIDLVPHALRITGVASGAREEESDEAIERHLSLRHDRLGWSHPSSMQGPQTESGFRVRLQGLYGSRASRIQKLEFHVIGFRIEEPLCPITLSPLTLHRQSLLP